MGMNRPNDDPVGKPGGKAHLAVELKSLPPLDDVARTLATGVERSPEILAEHAEHGRLQPQLDQIRAGIPVKVVPAKAGDAPGMILPSPTVAPAKAA